MVTQNEAEIASDGAIPFLFELSWRTLTQPSAASPGDTGEPPPPDLSGSSELDVLFQDLQDLCGEAL
jgi:hypothetical protein